MQTRNMGATLVAIFTMLVSAAAAAGDRNPGSNACAELAGAVYTNLVTTGLQRMQHAAAARYPASQSVRVCDQTARAVSAGFSRALNAMNLYVVWPTPEQQYGHICLSVDLTQCFPSQHPLMPPLGFSDTAYILNSWAAVQRSAVESMPAGAGSDISRFDRDAFGYQLRHRLQRVGEGRLRRD